MKTYEVYYEEEHHLVMGENYKTSLLIDKINCEDIKDHLPFLKRQWAKKGYKSGKRSTNGDNYIVSKIRFVEV